MRATMITDEEAWVNWGLRPPGRKAVQIVRPVMIGGIPHNVGDVVTLTFNDAVTVITSGRAVSYPPPVKEEESPEDLAKRRKEALNNGPYKVEITRPCQVKGFSCEPGEIVSVDEQDAMCLASSRGRIIGRPPEQEDIRERISRVVEEMLRGASM